MTVVGVISKRHQQEIVEEFFQLFKTPWEFYDETRRYDVVLTTEDEINETKANLLLIFGSEKKRFDAIHNIAVKDQEPGPFLEYEKIEVPIYGNLSSIKGVGSPLLRLKGNLRPAGIEFEKSDMKILRLGYDLFEEIRFLLIAGQPLENAHIPTLDLHILLLRSWILENDIPLIEIPPVPYGYNFIACLTHDVDFIGIRRHFLDHSMGGFLYRATLRSVINFIRKRASFLTLLKNLKATLSLPLVFLGISRDPWDQFDNYLDFELEQGVHSTYFFIPFKNRPGEGFHGKRQGYRAAKYDVADASNAIRKLISHGCEAGVHGIDAWHSPELAKKELDCVRQSTGQDKVGVRMHWLCLNECTFRTLDQAGYNYDSSFGYNETVGFRAGTAQVYRPIGANHLLELPLHIQDTAIFGSPSTNTSNDSAGQLCDRIIESVVRNMGALTILWHQRSLGPERLWGDFYALLIQELREKNAWFATAGDVVDWFRIRRSVRFTANGDIDHSHKPKFDPRLPQFVLRKHLGFANVHDQLF